PVPAAGLAWAAARAAAWIAPAEAAGGPALAVPGELARPWLARGDDGADGAGDEVLRGWGALLAGVLATTLDVAESLDPAGQGRLSFQGLGSLAAVRLFLARAEGGLPVTAVRDLIARGAVGELGLSRVRRQLDARARTAADPVRVLLDQLTALRAIEPSPAGEDRVRLTPLAQRALGIELAAARVQVTAVPDRPGRMSAAQLVALDGGLLPAELGELARQWAAARGPRAAGAELLGYAASAGAAARLVAIGFARGLGEGAAPAWREALSAPEVRPYARIELSRMASELAGSTVPLVTEPGPDDLTWLATDLLALACGEDDPDPDDIARQFREAVPAGQEEWILRLMSLGSHPDVVRVLTILGRHHPDRRVARDARRAAQQAAAHRAGRGRQASVMAPTARAGR
ncbi:MAG TPA: hypothetical protein VH478_08030, partial [Trebonia sp.]|nr:hypothetical protein [Trebonia sp.]